MGASLQVLRKENGNIISKESGCKPLSLSPKLPIMYSLPRTSQWGLAFMIGFRPKGFAAFWALRIPSLRVGCVGFRV